ncbi:MAG: NUDIX hydrolase [Clostridiales bacterium]|nr:NUDIX hydrolase [Clostridiales bacterium]
MKKLIKVNQLTNNKYLNMFELEYSIDGKPFKYFVASRRNLNTLSCKGENVVDAVRILPYFNLNGKMYVVLIKEFRYAINDYIYGVPAGLVDDGETLRQAAARELKEEIGADVVKLTEVFKPSYSSAGMTDESIACFEAEVGNFKPQKLESTEDIKLKIVDFDTLQKMLDAEKFGLQSLLQLKAFVYKKRLEKYEKTK